MDEFRNSMLAGCLYQKTDSVYIGMYEITEADYRTVNMGFGRKIYNAVKIMLFEYFIKKSRVANIPFYKKITPVIFSVPAISCFNIGKIFKISRIRKKIQIIYPVIR